MSNFIRNIINWHKRTYHLNWLKHLIGGVFIMLFTNIKFLEVELYPLFSWILAMIIGAAWEAFQVITKNGKATGIDLFWSQLITLLVSIVCLASGFENVYQLIGL